ncbi:MAG: alpha/beta fold hydrolase, partial [Arenimonas sp.]
MKIRQYLVLIVLLTGIFPAIIFGQTTAADSRLVFNNSRYVLVDDVRLHIREWGEKNSTACPVLLIHGFAGSTFSFRELAPALAKAGHPVLAID